MPFLALPKRAVREQPLLLRRIKLFGMPGCRFIDSKEGSLIEN